MNKSRRTLENISIYASIRLDCWWNNHFCCCFLFKLALGGDIDKDLSRSSSGLGLNHGLGRITGSASIETLVRVGIEKEHGLSPDSKMVVLHDFTPCVDDELEVKRGQIVNILYRENDWVYVIGQDTRQEGFIPHSYCAPYNTQLADLAIKKKLPREQSVGVQQPNNIINNNVSTATVNDLIDGTVELTADLLDDSTMTGLMDLQSSMLKQSQASLSSEPDFLPFAKDICGRYIVLYTFIARDENDVSVERGEFVTGKLSAIGYMVRMSLCQIWLIITHNLQKNSSEPRRSRMVLDRAKRWPGGLHSVRFCVSSR